MHNIKLVITYDGTAYLGWQKAGAGPSIEETLQKVIEQVLQHPVPLQAASRTDAGVHACGQAVNFITFKRDLDLPRLKFTLNRLLPKDIVVLSAEEMSFNFHPTLNCISKEYRYYICYDQAQLPYHRLYSWHVPYLLDVERMSQALPFFIGSHDFCSFCNVRKNNHYSDHFREVTTLKINQLEKKRLCISISGNHFLYKMVRSIVGTLVDIGKGKIDLEQLPKILAAKARPQAGVTAPAHGLFLHEVHYP